MQGNKTSNKVLRAAAGGWKPFDGQSFDLNEWRWMFRQELMRGLAKKRKLRSLDFYNVLNNSN